MIEVAPGQKHGHRGARQGPDLGEAEGRCTPWGLLGKEILGEGRNWTPGSAKGEEKEMGQV